MRNLFGNALGCVFLIVFLIMFIGVAVFIVFSFTNFFSEFN